MLVARPSHCTASRSVDCAATTGYTTPSADFVSLIDAPPTPSLSLDPTERWLLLLDNPPLPNLAQLCLPELRLAGLRFDPQRRLPARASGYMGMTLRPLFDQLGRPLAVGSAPEIQVEGLLPGSKVRSVTWRPDGGAFAFVVLPPELNAEPQLWFASLNFEMDCPLPRTLMAERLVDSGGNPLKLNGIRQAPLQWHPDCQRLLLTCVPWPPPPQPECMTGLRVPAAPSVQDAEPGVKAPSRTYADMLKTPDDEDEYEWHTTTQLLLYDLESRSARPLDDPAKNRVAVISPDGKFMMVAKTERPFSYAVGDVRFARKIEVLEVDGSGHWEVACLPLRDKIPTFMMPVRTFLARSHGEQTSRIRSASGKHLMGAILARLQTCGTSFSP